MQAYESMMIINAALEDQQIEEEVTKFKTLIETHGGSITHLDKWGRKRLAYMIDKHKTGFYVVYRFNAETKFITEFERLLRLDESIIRFITIKLEKNALEYFADQAAFIPAEAATAAVVEPVKESVKEPAVEPEAEAVEEVDVKGDEPATEEVE